jgi:hypothetical protein
MLRKYTERFLRDRETRSPSGTGELARNAVEEARREDVILNVPTEPVYRGEGRRARPRTC